MAIRRRRVAPDRGPAAGGLCAGPRHVLKYVEGQRARADAANKGRASRLVDSHPHDSGPRAGTCPKAEDGLCQRSARGYRRLPWSREPGRGKLSETVKRHGGRPRKQ